MEWLRDFQGLGVVFDIDALEEECLKRARKMLQVPDEQQVAARLLYGQAAWRIFMKIVSPRDITPCILLDGDTSLTLRGFYHNEFCIGIYGKDLDFEALRLKFLEASDYGLAPFHRRLIEKIALDRQPLVFFGRVDGAGRLATEEWSRREHTLCKEAGWPYAPEKVPAQLPPALAAELLAMRRPPLW